MGNMGNLRRKKRTHGFAVNHYTADRLKIERLSGTGRLRKRSINGNDAYLYALRVAYLASLLQPRAKRTRKQVSRAATSASFHDLMKEFSMARDSKSERDPHGFVKALEKRLHSIVISEDKTPEYHDANVRRTFAIFFNHFIDPKVHKQAEQSKHAQSVPKRLKN